MSVIAGHEVGGDSSRPYTDRRNIVDGKRAIAYPSVDTLGHLRRGVIYRVQSHATPPTLPRAIIFYFSPGGLSFSSRAALAPGDLAIHEPSFARFSSLSHLPLVFTLPRV